MYYITYDRSQLQIFRLAKNQRLFMRLNRANILFVPILAVVCPPPPEGVNTKPLNYTGMSFSYNTSFEYECLDGYVPYHPYRSNTKTSCTDKNTWSLDPPMKCTSKLCLWFDWMTAAEKMWLRLILC